jgi:hypothetical protein
LGAKRKISLASTGKQCIALDGIGGRKVSAERKIVGAKELRKKHRSTALADCLLDWMIKIRPEKIGLGC